MGVLRLRGGQAWGGGGIGAAAKLTGGTAGALFVAAWKGVGEAASAPAGTPAIVDAVQGREAHIPGPPVVTTPTAAPDVRA